MDWVLRNIADSWAPLVALVAGLVLLGLERKGRAGIGPVLVLLALAAAVTFAGLARPSWTALSIGIAVAALARDRDELLHGECALKLLWVMGAALALSWAGLLLLTVATGTPIVAEQWAVLQLGLEPRFLWSTALPLSLLIGLVMLGVAPFHFWVGDVFQGVRPWLAPLCVAALQVTGFSWLSLRLAGIEDFPAGARLVESLLRIAAMAAFLAGAATILVQRRPERRIGTLASLHGALVLARLAAGRPLDAQGFADWSAHLVLALTGASTLSRFLPVSSAGVSHAAPLVRRHAFAGLAGLVAVFSLAGVPGTPGARAWLDTARELAQSGQTGLLLACGVAWLAALGVALNQLREALGVAEPEESAPSPVPLGARVALWIAGLGLVALMAPRS